MGRWLSHMLFILAQFGTEGAMISYRHMPPPEPVEAACDGWIQSPPVIAFCTKELSQEWGSLAIAHWLNVGNMSRRSFKTSNVRFMN